MDDRPSQALLRSCFPHTNSRSIQAPFRLDEMSSSDPPLVAGSNSLSSTTLRKRHPTSIHDEEVHTSEHVDESSVVSHLNEASSSSTTGVRPLFDRTKGFYASGTTALKEIDNKWDMKREQPIIDEEKVTEKDDLELVAERDRENSEEVPKASASTEPTTKDKVDVTSEDDEEDDEDQVLRYLTGGYTSTPSTPTAPQSTPSPGAGRPDSNATVDPEEDKVCRICFDGEDPELGRLFSPCKCRGTSRHVHVACLATWRARSARSSSFYQCDQCGYRYRFRRTFFAQILSHKATLLSLTVILFLFLIYLAGFLANFIIKSAENRRAELAGTFFEDFWVSDHVILGEGVRDAVDFFGNRIENADWVKSADQKKILPDVIVDKVWNAPGFVDLLLHFTKGLSLVGLISSFHTFIATSFVSPLGRGVFRMLRPRPNGNGRPGQRDGTANLSQLVVVMFVIIGAVKAIVHTYHGVRWGAKKALARVENLVLDV